MMVPKEDVLDIKMTNEEAVKLTVSCGMILPEDVKRKRMNPHRTRVIFFPVKNTQIKLQKLARAARYHFFRKEHFLLQVPDKKAADYVDELLWKLPAEGFLPHAQAHETTEEFVVITEKKKILTTRSLSSIFAPLPSFLKIPTALSTSWKI